MLYATFAGFDNVRQRFTGQERDETNLDFFQARYRAAPLGRFLSPDPAQAGAALLQPQSWNAYSYVLNNPLSLVDPTGRNCVTFDDGTTGDDGEGSPCAGSHDPQQIDVNSGGSVLPFSPGSYGGGAGGGPGSGQQPSIASPMINRFQPQNTGSLGLTGRQACYADALVNGALGFVPGYNITKTLASFGGFNFNPVQFANGNAGPTTGFSSGATPLALGSPTGPQYAAGIASVAAIAADTNYAAAGGEAALNRTTDLISRGSFALQSASRQTGLLQQAASLERLANVASTAKNLGTFSAWLQLDLTFISVLRSHEKRNSYFLLYCCVLSCDSRFQLAHLCFNNQTFFVAVSKWHR